MWLNPSDTERAENRARAANVALLIAVGRGNPRAAAAAARDASEADALRAEAAGAAASRVAAWDEKREARAAANPKAWSASERDLWPVGALDLRWIPNPNSSKNKK